MLLIVTFIIFTTTTSTIIVPSKPSVSNGTAINVVVVTVLLSM